MNQYYVYILASDRNGTLYIGVTSDLIKRVYDHKTDIAEGFTKKHRVHRLVYYEVTDDINSAIAREKQLKSWNRKWKIDLIEKNNPQWEDLYPNIINETIRLDPRVKPEDDKKKSPRMTASFVIPDSIGNPGLDPRVKPEDDKKKSPRMTKKSPRMTESGPRMTEKKSEKTKTDPTAHK